MSMTIYKKGQRVRCEVTFKVNAVLTDPTAITFKYRKPDGTTVTHLYGNPDNVVKRSDVGLYYAEVITDQLKEWVFRFEGTGTCTAVEEQSFQIMSAFG